MRLSILTKFFAAVFVFAVLASNVLSQALPPPTADDEMGMLPYQSYHGGEIDSIGLTGGILNLNFPLLTYPQRGKLHLSFDLIYNSSWQHPAPFCVNVPKEPQSCAYIWGYASAYSALPVEKDDVVVAWGQ